MTATGRADTRSRKQREQAEVRWGCALSKPAPEIHFLQQETPSSAASITSPNSLPTGDHVFNTWAYGRHLSFKPQQSLFEALAWNSQHTSLTSKLWQSPRKLGSQAWATTWLTMWFTKGVILWLLKYSMEYFIFFFKKKKVFWVDAFQKCKWMHTN